MNYEAIIVGGGVAGASLSLLLGQAGMKICLLDKENHSSIKQNDFFKGKTASLNLNSIDLLKKMGIWEKISKTSKDFTNIEVWDSEGSSVVTFDAKEISECRLGKIAHNNNLLKSIFDLLGELPNVDLFEHQ